MDENENFLSKPRIGLARDLARNLLKKAKIVTYPVLLREVANQIPDLHIDGREMADGISGLQAVYKGESFIRFNVRHSAKRNRFTVAHELGHLLLGHNLDSDIFSLDSGNPKEVEANQFAAELLVPLRMLKDAVHKHKTVTRLARAFWVSKKAMNWRIMKTKLYTCLESWD